MKHVYLICCLCLSCLAGFGQNNRAQSLSIGLRYPAPVFINPNTGQNIVPTAFPLTLGYSFTYDEHHSFAFIAGGSSVGERTFGTPPNDRILPGFLSLSTRFDYRWTFLGNESRWQPYIGGGITTTLGILRETATTEARTGIFFSMHSMLGLKVNLTNRLFLSTEIPVTFWTSSGGEVFELLQLNQTPDRVIRSIWSSQRSQLWPVISIGVNL